MTATMTTEVNLEHRSCVVYLVELQKWFEGKAEQTLRREFTGHGAKARASHFAEELVTAIPVGVQAQIRLSRTEFDRYGAVKSSRERVVADVG